MSKNSKQLAKVKPVAFKSEGQNGEVSRLMSES